MKKLIFGFLSLVFALTTFAKQVPDEGMWLPMFVEDRNYEEMKEMGLQLTPDEIYDINNSSLKDAIVNFGNFCTGEIVSNQGLFLTNHHCGYGAIQEHSSVEHDYLTEGFWAGSFDEELSNDNLSATFFVRMDDVTDEILKEVTDDMTEQERAKAVSEAKKPIVEEAEEDGKYVASVKSFFKGNEYYLFVYEIYNDVRLVGAPPSSIGKFGGDTDNWMWPRHTGDFAMFRIYADKDGNPAEYSEDNVPLETEYALPLSLDGVEEGDFAMIWGYPGSTDRYRTSYGINATLNEINPAINTIGRAVLDAMEKNMDRSDEVRIAYASKKASISNLWKNKKGETRGLKKLNVIDQKRKIEDELMEWVNQSDERKEKYGNLMKGYREAYESLSEKDALSKQWYFGIASFGSSMLQFTMQNQGIGSLVNSDKDKDEIKEELSSFKDKAKSHFEDYDAQTEKDILQAILETLYNKIPVSELPDVYKDIIADYNADFGEYVDDMFENSIFATEENFMDFLDKPKKRHYNKDLAPELANSFQGKLMEIRGQNSKIQTGLNKNKRLFIKALREMNPEKAYYPDANFTMRLTYGDVSGYEARDAVYYDYYTTLEGVMEKEDPDSKEFVVPEKLKELYEEKDYGRYAAEDGTMRVCFLTDNDITGGNSGSPVLNGKGHLIGIAFDGNWEAMSGDIAFEPELQRTISVDIRYVLFVIDKYAGAHNLLEEMNLVKAKQPLPPVKKDNKKEKQESKEM
ncbi:MAG: S46 family peptidase [Bacteroidota bacterium]